MKNNLLKLYSMYDRKSGQYSQPFLQSNNATASRYFTYMCALDVNKMIVGDLELYCIGTYDVCTGEIVPEIKPVFICNSGEEVINNEEEE